MERSPDPELTARPNADAGASNPAALIKRGDDLLARNRASEAAASYEAALQANGKLTEAWEGLGMARQEQERFEDAITAFERALAIDPHSAVALANLGGLLLQTGKIEAAVAQLQKAIALMPQLAGLQANLGFALCKAGDPQAALQAFERTLALDPNFTEAFAGRAFAFAAMGRPEAAAKIFDFERFLASTQVTQVPGYESPDAFNRDLVAAVLSHPTLARDPEGKTTRLGAQTTDLLAGATGALGVLRQVLEEAAATYLRLVTSWQDTSFPVPVPARWHLQAWGTVLDQGGHQEPHLHRGVTASGVYYVQLAGPSAPDADGPQGAIEFGRPPADIGFPPAAEPRLVKPREGMLVMFAPYFWHRTIPWDGAQQRISIAFDIVPHA